MSDGSRQTKDTANKVREASGDAMQDDEQEEQPKAKLDKASAQNAADMEKVTDFKEEKEFSKGGNASAVLSSMSSAQSKSSTSPAFITLRKADIDSLVEHFEVKRIYAEKLLKKHHGDMKSSLRELMFGPGLTPPDFSTLRK